MTKEDRQERRVRFSIDGKSLPTLASESSDASGDFSDHEGGTEEEMEFVIDDGDGENEDDLIATCGDFEDMKDSSDESDESDLDEDDGYIETDSSKEEDEEGGGGDGMERDSNRSIASGVDNSSEASCVYVPPHLREGKDSKVQERLRKTVQGLINR